ncbi:MAG: DUF4266 domain-containing protein [Burkholderiaceae bacterium]|nr:DUF4266 domain-containing protein [Burkholderiaceae bacterium]
MKQSKHSSLARTLATGLLLLAAGALTGCATVQPWEKGNLAKPEMAFDGDPLQARFEQHVYFSKENASGGYGVGGGGCGCN